MLTVFIQVLCPVLIVFLAGYVVGKLFHLNNKTLSTLSLYVLTPALVFQAIYQYDKIFTLSTLNIFLAVTILMAVTIAGVEIAAKIFKFDKKLKTVLILTLTLTNTGNYGIPISEYAFGKEGMYLGSLLLVIYSFYTNTLGVFVASSEKSHWKTALKNSLKIPVFYALVAALVLNYFKVELPKPLFLPIQAVGISALPINLMIVGISLSRLKVSKDFLTVFSVSFIKLAIIPVVGFIILKLLHIGGLEMKVSLTQMAMPSAVYCSILANHYDCEAELTSAIVLVSMFLSILSLSGIINYLWQI